MTGEPPRRRETVSFILCLILYGGLLLRFNSFTAGGADSSGYLNAARLTCRGGWGNRDCQRHRSLAARLRRILCEFVRSQSETRRRLTDSPKSSWRLQDPNRQDDRLQALEL